MRIIDAKSTTLDIVHLGNIANNAFSNARLLEKAGCRSTVICYDYFDPVATPEWDEAFFPVDCEIDFSSRSWIPSGISYQRPDWFVQGYARTCQKFFIDRNSGPVNKENGLTHTHSIIQWWHRQRARAHHHSHRLKPYPKHWLKFKQIYQNKFPGSKPLSDRDLAMGYRWSYGWGDVLRKFTLIQAYACEPIIPMLLGLPYFAFEHGTLRDIPYEDSARGRLTALSYAMAEHIFVTNFDCLENALKLAEDKSKVSMINHPYDESKPVATVDASSLRARLLHETNADYLIFFPTRHDWVEGKGFNDKANDVLIRAIELMHRQQGSKIGTVLCEWGNNVEQTRSLVKSLGLTEHVKWMKPMPFSQFSAYCGASDIVADQFKLGSIGGIFFKALSLGVPVCTYINEEQFLNIYKELPPFINGRTVDSLAERLLIFLGNTADRQQLGEKAREWIEKHHAGIETTETQMSVYQSYLSTRQNKANNDMLVEE